MNFYPLYLSRPAIRRIIDRHAALLIHPRKLGLGRTEIHDSYIRRANVQAKRRGRSDLQEEELALTVEIDSCETQGILDLTFPTIHRAGFAETADFYVDWLRFKKRIDLDAKVYVYSFHPVDDVRYLHQRVHRGYTSDLSKAVWGEPEALSRRDLELLERRRRTQDEEFTRAAKRSIGLRGQQAARAGNVEEWQRLGAELALVLDATRGSALAGTAVAS